MACPTCNKRVLSHAYSIQCHYCETSYHMKCISLEAEYISQLKESHENWLCCTCIKDLFPYNQIEDDDFSQAILMKLESELKISNLIYNPHESNSFDYNYCTEFDPDVNFFCQQNIFSGYACLYYNEDSLNDKMSSFSCDEEYFSICHINIRSLKANIQNFKNYLQLLSIKFSVIGMTETWLDDTSCLLYSMPNYNFVESHRKNKSGGGVGIFLRDGILYKQRTDLSVFNDYCESSFIEIEKSVFGHEKNVVIGVFYRPPNTDIQCFIDVVKDICDKLRNENKLCYLLGDYNINLLNVDTDTSTADFSDVMFSNGFIPLITRPTRVTQSTATLIDNIFTNQLVEVCNASLQGILLTDISDHYPVFYVNNMLKKEIVTATISRRNFCIKNKNKFSQAMSTVDWGDVFSASDTQTTFTVFYRKLVKIHAFCFPLETISKQYNTRKPWLSPILRDAIKKKNKLYIKSIKHKCLHNETVYKNYRNCLKKLLKAAEKKYYNDLISKYKNDSKKVWSIIKTVINKNKKSLNQKEFKLGDGSLTSDMKLICNKFNEFFINVGPSLSKKIPTQNTVPSEYIKNKAVYSLYLEPVNECEIKKLISSLKSNTPGYDMIGSAALKWCVDFISEPLSHVCNMSLQEGIFPDELKIANVIPLYKCDDPKLFNNYRPVSVLSSVSKVFERIMYNRFVSYLNEYKILFSYQFGFRKIHSTYMALMTLMDKLTKCLDNDEYIIGVFLDFSKAFDTVDHVILLQKLSVYGVRGNALSWFESYLKNRQQFVTYNGVLSDTKILQCGVPQGSILGPLLFLIYINDLANVCTSSFPILFADDTNLFNHGKDMFSLQVALNQELANISKWLKVNKLSLNIKKTCTWFSHEKKQDLQMYKLKLIMK